MHLQFNWSFYRICSLICNQIFLIQGLIVILLGALHFYKSPNNDMTVLACCCFYSSISITTYFVGMQFILKDGLFYTKAYLLMLVFNFLIVCFSLAFCLVLNPELQSKVFEEAWENASPEEKAQWQHSLNCCGLNNYTRSFAYDDHPICKDCCYERNQTDVENKFLCHCASCSDMVAPYFGRYVAWLSTFNYISFFLLVTMLHSTFRIRKYRFEKEQEDKEEEKRGLIKKEENIKIKTSEIII